MPYKNIKELPENLKLLPNRAKRIFMNAFNASFDMGEESARKIAWSAVKRKFIKNNRGEWILKKETKTIQSFIELYNYKIQAFSESEILSMIDKEVLNKIKEKDKHPFFQAYTLAHEGISSPKMLGENDRKPIYWPKVAIQSMKNFIKNGINFFRGHNKDNSIYNRKSLGQIVGSATKEINGRLSNIIVGYFPPETREEAKKYDICSQESVWNFIDKSGNLIADSIEKLTGIALASSKDKIPAFSDAKRLGLIQAFENIDGQSTNSGNEGGHEMPDINNYYELVEAIKKFNVFPSQLFSWDQIRKDRDFNENFESYENSVKELETAKKTIETLTNEKADLNKKVELNSLDTRIEQFLKSDDLKLTDKQTKFIKTKFDKDKSSLADVSDDGLKGYINNQLDTFKLVANLNGSTDNNIDIENNDPVVNGDDYTKAENNPLLDEDL